MTNESQYAILDELSTKFMRSVKMHYSRDTAVDVMNALQPILGKDWAGRVLFNMLSDQYNDIHQFKISCPQSAYQKINAIKEIRSVTGMGLSDSKRLVEMAEISPQIVPLTGAIGVTDQRIGELIQNLRSFGVIVAV